MVVARALTEPPARAFAGTRSASAFAAITTVGTMGGFFAQSLMPLAAHLTGAPIGAMLVPAACNALVLLVVIGLRTARTSPDRFKRA